MKRSLLLLTLLPFFAFQLAGDKKPRIKKLEKEFAFIPSGSLQLDGKTVSVQAYYISKVEVTNKEYRTFLDDLKANNRLEEFNIACPDTAKWNVLGFKAFQDYYFNHPAYEDYPVVCVSYEGAELYCKWFTEKKNAALKGKYTLQFRLPLREEFVRACRGDNPTQKYAWKNNGIRNKDSMILCNHVHPDNGGIAGQLNDNVDVIAPSRSYWPNEFGIYNLNGNVAEMTNKKGTATGGSWRNKENDVQNESTMNFEGPSPTVGFRMVTTFLYQNPSEK